MTKKERRESRRAERETSERVEKRDGQKRAVVMA